MRSVLIEELGARMKSRGAPDPDKPQQG
jgi:hypothetical protein